ncbi:MAG: hypothetical protein HY804_13410 [Nitrospinae bacterium]|nr:hypothetical protein [Nitrospinota bacterium]
MNKRRMVIALTGAALAALGAWRLAGSGIDVTSLDAGLARSYLLHIGAGAFFGWGFVTAALDKISWRAPLRIAATVSPILFLAVIHQTKTAINDGPAAIAMGLAVAVCGVMLSEREG